MNTSESEFNDPQALCRGWVSHCEERQLHQLEQHGHESTCINSSSSKELMYQASNAFLFKDKHLQSILPTRCAQTTHFLTKSKKTHFLTKSMINCIAANYKPYQTIFWKETLVSGDGNYQAKDKSKTILCSSPLELSVHPGSPWQTKCSPNIY